MTLPQSIHPAESVASSLLLFRVVYWIQRRKRWRRKGVMWGWGGRGKEWKTHHTKRRKHILELRDVTSNILCRSTWCQDVNISCSFSSSLRLDSFHPVSLTLSSVAGHWHQKTLSQSLSLSLPPFLPFSRLCVTISFDPVSLSRLSVNPFKHHFLTSLFVTPSTQNLSSLPFLTLSEKNELTILWRMTTKIRNNRMTRRRVTAGAAESRT